MSIPFGLPNLSAGSGPAALIIGGVVFVIAGIIILFINVLGILLIIIGLLMIYWGGDLSTKWSSRFKR